MKIQVCLNNLIWKLVWEIISSITVFNHRFPLPLLDCCFCNNAPETLEHLFLQCDWVKKLWLLALWPLNLSNKENLFIQYWVKFILKPKAILGLEDEVVGQFQLCAIILCDHIWMERYKTRVDDTKSSPIDLSRQIFKSYMEHKGT